MRLEDVNRIKQEAATTFMNVIAAIFVTIKSGRLTPAVIMCFVFFVQQLIKYKTLHTHCSNTDRKLIAHY